MKTCFCHLKVVWRLLAQESLAISMQSIHRWKVHLAGYNSVAVTIRVYLHSFSCYCLRNTRNVAKFQENFSKLIQGQGHHQGHPRSSILVSMESPYVTSFLLAINCNFSRICYRFRDIHAYRVNIEKCWFYPPLHCFTPPLGGPLIISGWNLTCKN